jgi:hypothetical protein
MVFAPKKASFIGLFQRFTMKHHWKFLFLPLLLCSLQLPAQMLTPFVTAAAGDYFFNTQANAALSFTIGEMTMVETYPSNNGFMLTQGFQQPVQQLVAIQDQDFAFEFVVFPNPASDRLNFRYDLQYAGLVQMHWTDMRGVEVLNHYQDRYSGGQVEDYFDLNGIASGMYFLHVSYDVPGKGIAHNSIYKINVLHH